ncbi:MAG: carboxypeptidase-like regulatory domain-containing protein [Acidobacteriota bacterium]|nr:carboxypeptidase-like regulatory domain-containing protein [Acidobacteriota bacterium]
MKKILGATAALLFATTLAAAWQYPSGGPPSSGPVLGLGRGSSETKREKPPEFRYLTGVVLDKADSPVKDAIVYLKNRKTKAQTTYIADADGAFRFPNLSRTTDYELFAELKGQKSPVKTLSSLDNRTNAKINLHVEPQKDKGKDAEKAAEKIAEKTPEKPAEKDKPRIDDRVHPPQSPN